MPFTPYARNLISLRGSLENVSAAMEHEENSLFFFNVRTDRIMKGKLNVITE